MYGVKKLVPFFILLLFVAAAVIGVAEAGVTLKGYTDNGSAYEYVVFGRYPQGHIGDTQPGSGSESVDWVKVDSPNSTHYPSVTVAYFMIDPIVWRILSADQGVSNGKALLFSEKNLDEGLFHSSSNNYGTSAIRSFLVGSGVDGTGGGIFANLNYFGAAEKSVVSADAFESKDGQGNGSVTTTNPIFLLSEVQLKNITYGFVNGTGSDSKRIGKNTGYTASKGSVYGDDQPDAYWTRSPVSGSPGKAWYVDPAGTLGNHAVDVSGVAVRPAFFLNLESVIFKSKSSDVLGSTSAAAGGSILNPFFLALPEGNQNGVLENLKFKSADIPLKSADIDGNTLTLTFGKNISPAVRSWPDNGDFALKRAGKVDLYPTSVISADADKLVLTFASAVSAGDTVKLAYNLNYDAVSFDVSGTVVSVMASSPDIAVTNLTQGGGNNPGDPDPDPTQPSTATTPGKITVTIGGTTYEAEAQSGGGYLILLPVGTDPALLKGLPLGITLPKGAVISPDPKSGVDFSNGPVTFTITAEDKKTTQTISVTIRISEPQTVPGTVVTADTSKCSVAVTYNTDGSLSVEIRLPLVSGFDPTTLDGLYALLSRLSGLSFAYVDGDGNVVPMTPRTANDPYLRITGTAADKAALEGAVLSSLSYWLKNDATEYKQTFNPALNLSDMQVTYTNEPPTEPEEPWSSGSSGCDAGFGVVALLVPLALGCVVVKRRR